MSKASLRRRFDVGTRVCYKDGNGVIGAVEEVRDLTEFGLPGEWTILVRWPGAAKLDGFGLADAVKYLKTAQPPRALRRRR